MKKAATVWRENGVEFVAQLGDIIDSRAKKHNGSEMECEKVSVDRFQNVPPVNLKELLRF